MKPKQLLLILALLLSYFANAQHYTCEYDAAGNRIKRYYINTGKNPAPPVPIAEDTVVIATTAMPEWEDNSLNYIQNEENTIVSQEEENVNSVQEWEDTNNIQEEAIFRMVLYPNPTNGYFTLELPDLQLGTVGNLIILSKMGVQVYSQNYLTQVQSIDISAVPTDLYLVRIVADNKLYVVSIIKN